MVDAPDPVVVVEVDVVELEPDAAGPLEVLDELDVGALVVAELAGVGELDGAGELAGVGALVGVGEAELVDELEASVPPEAVDAFVVVGSLASTGALVNVAD